MTDNVLETIRHLLQDTIAPDLRELKARVDALDAKMTAQFTAVDSRFTAVDTKFGAMESRFAAVDARLASLEREMIARFDGLDHRLDTMADVAALVASQSAILQRLVVLEAKVEER